MKTEIRLATAADAPAIAALYREVARLSGGLARTEDEITTDYIEGNLTAALTRGLCLIAESEGRCVGEIHACAPAPKQFAHVLGDLTVAVSPATQGQGIGRRLFEALIAHSGQRLPHIRRIELLCREGNKRGIALYESLGFVQEGRLKGRVRLPDGTVEDDLYFGLILNSKS
ncbi:GNAT family N-acetyltransferase [Asticcacaulis sp. AND118]|uniref:GNAT family N-acetyltransferase n=1 Tax=Asticcacaulis sp. AND118 TaxID=2840468 RepID=UPI001CFF832A|nr:GNAT family N-acetyltransferase [Asticcacaulis sp. AND118]UDF02742.1 GNAT family N-acetyltransferase [Asticcacaulis sp. AND118]